MSIDPNNPDTSIEAGDKVRSHDFPHRFEGEPLDRPPCYVEGTVLRVQPRNKATQMKIDGEFREVIFHDCDRYVIRVERRVFGGEEWDEPFEEYVFPPVNGTPKGIALGDATHTFGVEKIDES